MVEPIALIFFDFFTQLKREVGIELDLKQYQDFLALYILGNWKRGATEEKELEKNLLHLCKSLWLTGHKFEEKFEVAFSESFSKLNKYLQVKERKGNQVNEKESLRKEDFQNVSNESKGIEEDEVINEIEDGNNEEEDFSPPTVSNDVTNRQPIDYQDVFLNFDDTKNKGNFVHSSNKKKISVKNTPFIFSDYKHFPVSNRKSIQVWRRLKNKRPLSVIENINIKATIKTVAKGGFLSEPEFHFRKAHQLHFWIFIEHQGNMVAFEDWTEQLKQVLVQSNPNNSVVPFYYYRYPTPIIEENEEKDFKLFTNKRHNQSIKLSNLLKDNAQQNRIIIFSDAGGLEKTIDDERLNETWNFIQSLEKYTKKIVWFNPLPKANWSNSSAIYTSFFTNMVTYNLNGVRQAVKLLK